MDGWNVQKDLTEALRAIDVQADLLACFAAKRSGKGIKSSGSRSGLSKSQIRFHPVIHANQLFV